MTSHHQAGVSDVTLIVIDELSPQSYRTTRRMNPTERDDVSRFLVHLTRDYEGKSAEDNLFRILTTQKIEARNAHCLFHRKFDQLAFSGFLKRKFNTVCLTEVPFSQLRHLATDILNRRIKLKPFGIIFTKATLLERGASPALYINAKGTSLRDYLISQFDQHFSTRGQYNKLKKDFGADADSIINYYSLINVISANHDFSWEREWRHPGDIDFNLIDISAIIAEDPDAFKDQCKNKFLGAGLKHLLRIPVVSPLWNVERIIHELSVSLWNA